MPCRFAPYHSSFAFRHLNFHLEHANRTEFIINIQWHTWGMGERGNSMYDNRYIQFLLNKLKFLALYK